MRIARRHFLAGASAPLILGLDGAVSARQRAGEMAPAMAQTTAGPVLGRRDRGAIAFKGIRYGASTTGTGRFMPPSPPSPWTEPRTAFDYGPIAPQRAPGARSASIGIVLPESEDCLTLNVWTPALRDKARRPVMVWLHGGGLWRLSAAGATSANVTFPGAGRRAGRDSGTWAAIGAARTARSGTRRWR